MDRRGNSDPPYRRPLKRHCARALYKLRLETGAPRFGRGLTIRPECRISGRVAHLKPREGGPHPLWFFKGGFLRSSISAPSSESIGLFKSSWPSFGGLWSTLR